MQRVRTGRQLVLALDKGAKITEEHFAEMLKKLAINAFRELVMRSATDTGYLRSKWSVTTSTPPNTATKGRRPRGWKKGNSPIYPDANYPNVSIKAGDIIVLYNNTEYAIYLETGTPRMAAQPMVEPTYRMLQAVARRLSRQLSLEFIDV